MAVPYLAAQAGFGVFILVLMVAFLLNLYLNLMLTEILLRDGRDLQIVELIRTYVFRGRFGSAAASILLPVLAVSFIASLTAYISGAGIVVSELTGLPSIVGQIIIYLVSAMVVFFGLKSVGYSEKIALYLLILFIVLIVAGSIGDWSNPVSAEAGSTGFKGVLALYGLVLYSLNAVFAVPQAVKGLGRHPQKSVIAVWVGTSINVILVFFVTLVAIAVSKPVSEVAVTGIGEATNRFVYVAGSLFVVFAMITTYWSVSLALSDIISERYRLAKRVSWTIATVPTLILIIIGRLGFIEYLQIAGGIVALILIYVTVPMYRRAQRETTIPEPGWTLGRLGATPVLAIFMLGMILMAIGTLLGM